MSVLACDRIDCEKIMCDRLILDGRYYICDRCWEELLYYKSTWPNSMSKADVRKKIEEFFDTHVGSYEPFSLSSDEVNEEFNRLTKTNVTSW